MTLGMEGLRAALAYANVLAVLRCVRHSESNNAEDGSAYWLLFGGGRASSLARHPRIAIKSPWGWTSAAGAYQAMCAVPGKVQTDTWGDFCRAMGTTADEMPFDEQTQDLFAVWCLRRRGALSDAIAGNLPAVVEKCSHEWASWPPGRYGQPTTTYAKLEAVYLAYGGTLAASDSEPIAQMIDTQPAAPIEDRSTQMEQQPAASPSFDWSSLMSVGGAIASAFNPFVGAAIAAFAPLLQQKIEKEVGRHTDPATAKLVTAQLSGVIEQAATKATGKSDPVAAVAELRSNPAAVAQVEKVVEQKLIDMAPLLDQMHKQAQERFAAEVGDRNDAATRVKKAGWNIQKPLVFGGIAITVFVVVFLLVALVVQITLANDHLPDPTLIAFSGPIIVMGMRGIERAFAFAFGGEISGSPAADARINQARAP